MLGGLTVQKNCCQKASNVLIAVMMNSKRNRHHGRMVDSGSSWSGVLEVNGLDDDHVLCTLKVPTHIAVGSTLLC